MTLTDVLPRAYGWVIFCVLLVLVQVTVIGFKAMYARKKYFTKAFFEKHFPEEVKAGKIDVRFGYPDVGMGRYADKLSLDEWVELNNAQRGHLNYLDTVAPVIVFMLVAGLTFTRITLIVQVVYLVARWFYFAKYAQNGPKGRYGPVSIIYLCFLCLGTLAGLSAILIGGGIHGLVEVFW